MKTIEDSLRCPAIEKLNESSKTLDNGEPIWTSDYLEWIPYSELTVTELLEHSNDQIIYHANKNDPTSPCNLVEMLRLGTRDECTKDFIQEFARIYSLTTHK